MTSIAVWDFNGNLDVAVFLPGKASVTAGEVRILLGKGDGTLQAPKVPTLTVSTSGIAAGDFNGAKKTDLIVNLTRENQRGVPGPGSAGPTGADRKKAPL